VSVSVGRAKRNSAVPLDLVVEVKRGVRGLRSVREALLRLAYQVSESPRGSGLLVLVEPGITFERLGDEWAGAISVLRKDLLDRLNICIVDGDRFLGFPDEDLEPGVRSYVEDLLRGSRSVETTRTSRGDAPFVVLKVLLYQWLTSGSAVTTNWLVEVSGFSYPTVASALRRLGSLVERGSDRRVRLRWFPREEFARLVAVSDRVRNTIRFAGRSAQPRSPEAHLRRLEKLRPPNLAIGGVLGAAHYHPELDLVGVPRLDVSLYDSKRQFDLGFVEKLDPALERVDDPLAPAMVVVHQVRQAEAMFAKREGGLMWADPVDCLLDLHEAHLDAQATQLLKALERNRPKAAA
jgi:hypothetical protein